MAELRWNWDRMGESVFTGLKAKTAKSAKSRKVELELRQEFPDDGEIRSSLGDFLGKMVTEHGAADDTLVSVKRVSRDRPPRCTTDRTVYSPGRLKNVQTEVHSFILKSGEELLEKHRSEAERKYRRDAESLLRGELCVYEAKHREDMRLYEEALRVKYENYRTDFERESEERFQAEQRAAIVEGEKRIRKAVAKERSQLLREMLRKLRLEVSRITSSLYLEFEQTFHARQQTMITDFNQIIRNERIKLKKILTEFENHKSKDLYVQKRELEVENVTNILNTLCAEKLKSRAEKHTMHIYFQSEIGKLCRANDQLYKALTRMKERMKHSEKREKLLEEELANALKELKKLVHFASRSVPASADFLLPFEKLAEREGGAVYKSRFTNNR